MRTGAMLRKILEGTVNRDEALTFLQQHKQAVLATIGKDGRPQLTNVLVVYKDGRLVASITETRVKYRNLQHDPRVTVLIQGDSFWEFLVVEGIGTMTSMPDALPALREYYRLAAG